MIRKESQWRWLLFLGITLVPAFQDLSGGLVALGRNCRNVQAPPSLPLPTADSITQYLLLSMVLTITLLHMTSCNVACQGWQGCLRKNLHRTYFIQNLNVKQHLQLHAQLLPDRNNSPSISPDLEGRAGWLTPGRVCLPTETLGLRVD